MDDKPVTEENNTPQDTVSSQHNVPVPSGVSGKSSTQQAGSSEDPGEISKIDDVAGLISNALGHDKVMSVEKRDETIGPEMNMAVKDLQDASQSVLKTSDYIPVYEEKEPDMVDKNTSVITNVLEKVEVSQHRSNIEDEEKNVNLYELEGEEADVNIKMQSSQGPIVKEETISNPEQNMNESLLGASADTFIISSSILEGEIKEDQPDKYTIENQRMLPTPVKIEEIVVCMIPEPIVREEQDGDKAIFQEKVASKLIIDEVIVCNRPESIIDQDQDINRPTDATISSATLGEDIAISQMHRTIAEEGLGEDTTADLRKSETPSLEEPMLTNSTPEPAMDEEGQQQEQIDFRSSLIAQLDEAKLAAVSIRELCKSIQFEMEENAELGEMDELQAPDVIKVEDEVTPIKEEKVLDEVTLAEVIKVEEEPVKRTETIVKEVTVQEPLSSAVSATRYDPRRSHWQRFLNCLLCGMIYSRNALETRQESETSIQILKSPNPESMNSLQLLKAAILEEEQRDKKETTSLWVDPLEANLYSMSTSNPFAND